MCTSGLAATIGFSTGGALVLLGFSASLLGAFWVLAALSLLFTAAVVATVLRVEPAGTFCGLTDAAALVSGGGLVSGAALGSGDCSAGTAACVFATAVGVASAACGGSADKG